MKLLAVVILADFVMRGVADGPRLADDIGIRSLATGSAIQNLLLISAVTVFVYYAYGVCVWIGRRRRVAREFNKLPGDDGHWFSGNIRQHPGPNDEGLKFILDYARRHGNKAVRFWMGPFRPVAMLVHPDTVKLVLRTTEPKAISGAGQYSWVRSWLGDGLLVSSGAKWLRSRRLLTPAFHFEILKSYMEVYNEATDILLEKWGDMLNKKPEESIEIFSSVSLCTFNIILRCAFSYTEDVQRMGQSHPFVSHVAALVNMVSQRKYKYYMHFDWTYYKTATGREFATKCNYVHNVADSIIAKRKQALQETGGEVDGRHLDFLDILLLARDEEGHGLTDLEIRNEVNTFLFAGHDTTSTAISWALYNLANHPDIQERVYDEIQTVTNKHDSSTIACDDLNELPYLTMCIKESLRTHPPVPWIGRDVTKPLDVNGVTLLPGTIIDINIYAVHHNPMVWGEDHMEYKPERFHPDNMKRMDSYAFIPFAAGPRNCLGQTFALHEVKVVVARILHRYSLRVDPNHKIMLMPQMVIRARHGIKLFFTQR